VSNLPLGAAHPHTDTWIENVPNEAAVDSLNRIDAAAVKAEVVDEANTDVLD